MRISFLWKGCSAVLLKISGGISILMDPGDHFSLEEVDDFAGSVDVVMYTHEHSGHFDPKFLDDLVRKYSPYIVVNKGVFRTIRRRVDWDKLINLKEGESAELLGMKVHALKAVHPGIHPVVFLLEVMGKALFHGDSTAFSRMFEAFSPVDLAFIPSGSPSPSASPKDAVRIARSLIPNVVVPFHGNESELREVEESIRLSNLDVEVIVPPLGEPVTLEV